MDDPVVRFLGLLVALIPIVPILLFVVAWGMPRRNWEFVGTALFFGASVAFIAVFASAVLALGTESLTNAHLQAFVGALLVVALPEEFVKFLPLVFILMRHHACRGPADVMVAAVGVGLGFAALENVFYVMEEEEWIGIGWLRAYSAVPAHAMFGIIMGYFAALSSKAPTRRNSCCSLDWRQRFFFTQPTIFQFSRSGAWRLSKVRRPKLCRTIAFSLLPTSWPLPL